MKSRQGTPGVSRADRLSQEGLDRLDRQLTNAGQVSDVVLSQWIKRYGEPARALIRKHGRYHDELEAGV
jgi:hypothetical protein